MKSLRRRDTKQRSSPLLDEVSDTGWRRTIGSLKLQVIFRKRATNLMAFLRKMTCKDKASYDSTPPWYTKIALVFKWSLYLISMKSLSSTWSLCQSSPSQSDSLNEPHVEGPSLFVLSRMNATHSERCASRSHMCHNKETSSCSSHSLNVVSLYCHLSMLLI